MFGIVDPPKQGSLRFQVYDASKSQPDERRNCRAAQTGDPSETVRRRVGRSPRSTPGAGEGRWRGARREATGLGMEDGGAWVEGSATEGAWVGREARGVRAGREDGGERDGAHEDGGERDGRRVGGEGRRKGVGGAHGCGRGWGGKMEGVAWVWTGLGSAWVWRLARLIC